MAHTCSSHTPTCDVVRRGTGGSSTRKDDRGVRCCCRGPLPAACCGRGHWAVCTAHAHFLFAPHVVHVATVLLGQRGDIHDGLQRACMQSRLLARCEHGWQRIHSALHRWRRCPLPQDSRNSLACSHSQLRGVLPWTTAAAVLVDTLVQPNVVASSAALVLKCKHMRPDNLPMEQVCRGPLMHPTSRAPGVAQCMPTAPHVHTCDAPGKCTLDRLAAHPVARWVSKASPSCFCTEAMCQLVDLISLRGCLESVVALGGGEFIADGPPCCVQDGGHARAWAVLWGVRMPGKSHLNADVLNQSNCQVLGNARYAV
jgi:hypothetical protein